MDHYTDRVYHAGGPQEPWRLSAPGLKPGACGARLVRARSATGTRDDPPIVQGYRAKTMDTSPTNQHPDIPRPASVPDLLEIHVPIATRAVITGNLFLATGNAGVCEHALTGLREVLAAWQGPGVLVLAGNIFDVERTNLLEQAGVSDKGENSPLGSQLVETLRTFLSAPSRRAVILTSDPAADFLPAEMTSGSLCAMGLDLARAVDLILDAATGTRTVRIESRAPKNRGVGLAGLLPPAASWSDPRSGWLYGIDKLCDPSSLPRFVTSRLFYRQLARYSWLLLLPFALALALKLPFIYPILSHTPPGHLIPARDIYHARYASWEGRMVAAAVSTLIVLCAIGLAAAVVAKRTWGVVSGTLLGKSMLGNPGLTTNDHERNRARELVASGWAGLITCGALQAELTHLDTGFYANIGANTEVVEEVAAHIGLPSVFPHRVQLSWVELEAGSEVHARLLRSSYRARTATLFEKIATLRNPALNTMAPSHPPTFPSPGEPTSRQEHAAVVAAFPHGATWPPEENLARKRLRVRRLAAGLLAITGLLDIASVARPPLQSHLQVILAVLPFAAAQAAAALIALSGLALLALARGARLGQQRSWFVSVYLIAATTVVHLAKGGDIPAVVVGVVVEWVLVSNRRHFQAASDRASLRSAFAILAVGTLATTVVASLALEATLALHHQHVLAIWNAFEATATRMVGLESVSLPASVNHFFAPALLAIGLAIAVVALFLATRPVIIRGRELTRTSEARSRDIVRRHGSGTLDYFALREEKQHFFDRDSLVAYAVYGGICLVSPDPIGPTAEREQVWRAFRRHADSNGWPVAVMAASEEWLPIYRSAGMHDFYLGDEAIVDTTTFTLAGGANKGLRQAHNRIANHGYSISFADPARLDTSLAQALRDLMAKSRRGDQERGFSMTLGRAFDPRDTGLLLAIASAPDGRPVAFCQFAPAPGIDGYSLDLMRHDTGEHPNGLIDFVLVETILHLREIGKRGLSLNFAAMRSLLAGDANDGISRKMERWFYRKMSDIVQIESLWRFTAKYHPGWKPRYVAYESPEHLVPIGMAILRAEAVWEMPIIGKLLAPSSGTPAEPRPGTDQGAGAASHARR